MTKGFQDGNQHLQSPEVLNLPGSSPAWSKMWWGPFNRRGNQSSRVRETCPSLQSGNRELRPSSQGRKCRGPDFRPDVNHLYAHVFYTSAHILSSLSGTLWNLKFPLSHQPCFYKAIYTSTISTPPSTCQVLLTPWDPKHCLLSSLPSATHLLLLSLLHPQDYSS